MKNKLIDDLSPAIWGFAIGFLLGVIFNSFQEEKHQHDLAVKANAAEYYLDSQNQRQFRYKTK